MEPIRRHRAEPLSPSRGGRRDSGAEEAAPVYPPREDTLLLARFARVPPGTRVLEIGTGSGYVALTAARLGARVVATDRNMLALQAVSQRARSEGVPIDLVRTDLAHGLGRFHRVLANPPYLPTRVDERDPDPLHNLALDGGPDGCRVTARIVEELHDHLVPDGCAFLVVSSLQQETGLTQIRAGWFRSGGTVEVVDSRAFEGERLEVWKLSRGRG